MQVHEFDLAVRCEGRHVNIISDIVREIVHVVNPPAGQADKVGVGRHVGVIPVYVFTGVEALDEAHFFKGPHGFVDGVEADGREGLSHLPVNVLRRGVGLAPGQQPVNQLSLRCGPEALFFKQFFDISHVFTMRIIIIMR